MQTTKKNTDKFQRIIQAAAKIFARKGFYNSKVSEIAKEASVADGTIYLYFHNKDDILISIFEVRMDSVLRNMKEKLAAEPNPAKKIEVFAFNHLKMVEDNREMAEVIQVELRQSSKFMKEYKNEKFLQYLQLIADIVQEGQNRNIFRKDILPGVAKRAFFGALDEMSRYWVLSTKKKYHIATAAKQISQMFVDGMSNNRKASTLDKYRRIS